ncbi:hypothetical protein RDWZM_008001 [Blomia tropicalis]|uniref:Oxysterol-binding protein n=1 Tax=Blomia tropicalis TaxID=40697 RepID=A0A9Q0M0V6_BLOTA|nr:hypothetical protein RDWZM_008001 [Blomia tropicalis]
MDVNNKNGASVVNSSTNESCGISSSEDEFATKNVSNEQIMLNNNKNVVCYNPNIKIKSSGSGSQLSSLEHNLVDHQLPESIDIVSKQSYKDENKWQILEGLKDGQRFEEKPLKFSGFMLKRRKRPLKGWHKRFFCLENGRLSYAKSASDITKGKTHGSIDVGLSVISTKSSSRRIDIDSEYYIFHLKVKKIDNFNQWVNALKSHRLARQHEINYGNSLNNLICDNGIIGLQPLSNNNRTNDLLSPELTTTKFNEIEIDDDLLRLQEKLIKLSSLLKTIEVSTGDSITDFEGFKYKKPRRRFHLRKKKSNVSKSVEHPIENHVTMKDDQLSLKGTNYLSLSHPSLAEEECGSHITTQTDGIDETRKPLSKTEAMNQFILVANELNSSYRELLKSFQEERAQRIRLDSYQNTSTDDWRTKRMTSMTNNRVNSLEEYDEPTFHQNLSRYSLDDTSVLSMSEYYDAEDKVSRSDYNSSTSEEDDDDESVITDFSEDGANYQSIVEKSDQSHHTGRRTMLPSVQPSSDISLWTLLCKNIGKDLSKISMPVTINEPLNVLQRLCEELEYCELLDMAATVDDPVQRMLLMASFAISAYSSSSYRAGHKPFNPLLGETYECVREDKGFRFQSEQVSHHPPISACHAESDTFIFWQDLRVKSKFWGKSMEVIPFGMVNVILKPYNCHYKWNKITTCVHNLFKGERYVDNYGELTITDGSLTCKITFEKAGYWSNRKNEISGVITTAKGDVIEKLFGRWNESIYCGTSPSTRCIWRPGSMPENHSEYYGFSRFAIELNELTDDDRLTLPPTDTRFRPDQRLLEEGNIAKAESIKLELEQAQRDRRRSREERGIPEYEPLWFREMVNNEEVFICNGKYWEAKENHFNDIEFTQLW